MKIPVFNLFKVEENEVEITLNMPAYLGKDPVTGKNLYDNNKLVPQTFIVPVNWKQMLLEGTPVKARTPFGVYELDGTRFTISWQEA